MKNSIPYKILKITQLKRRYIDQQTKPLGFTRVQWQTLAWLSVLGTPCPQRELLKETEFDAAQLSRILDQLQKKQLVKRKVDENNRRMCQIELTKSGRDACAKIAEIVDKESKAMLKRISNNNQKVLSSLLDAMIDNLETMVD